MPFISPQSLIAAAHRPASPGALPWLVHYGAPAVVHTGYVSQTDLQTLDTKVAGEAQAVDAAVSQCPNLAPADQAMWNTTYASWQAVHGQVTTALASSFNPFGIGYGSLATSLSSIEDDIMRMQGRVHAACPGAIGAAGTGPTANWMTTLVTLGVIAAVIAGFWFLSPIVLAAIGGRDKSKPSSSTSTALELRR
jgi:hypothetical protein